MWVYFYLYICIYCVGFKFELQWEVVDSFSLIWGKSKKQIFPPNNLFRHFANISKNGRLILGQLKGTAQRVLNICRKRVDCEKTGDSFESENNGKKMCLLCAKEQFKGATFANNCPNDATNRSIVGNALAMGMG